MVELERGKGAPVEIGGTGKPEMVPVWAMVVAERARRVERMARALIGAIMKDLQ